MLDLTINDLEIELGMPLSRQLFQEYNMKKAGPLSGIKIPRGAKLYWSKNCQIKCFQDRFSLLPNLDVKSGKDMMYGTSAYLFFAENSLYKVIFQLVGNPIAAGWIVGKFKEAALETIGPSTWDKGMMTWSNYKSQLIIDLKEESQHAHFHWKAIQNE